MSFICELFRCHKAYNMFMYKQVETELCVITNRTETGRNVLKSVASKHVIYVLYIIIYFPKHMYLVFYTKINFNIFLAILL